ncbi:MAG TPA: D-alanine--D-alanine ligase family protein [Candidatus Eisenbacteria bacterium]|nr:D-alanine--D-alanine ligase family protein [Candidatus Eisenbacteria bacterium]
MDISNLNVCVLFGGQNSEHDISRQSAVYIIDVLHKLTLKKVYTMGISKEGECKLFHGGKKEIEDGSWLTNTSNQDVLFKLGHEGQGFYTCDKSLLAWHDVDLFFPVLHGKLGEDGTIQGLFEMLNSQFVGCGVLASSVSMDKVISRMLFDQVGIPQAAWTWVRNTRFRDQAEKCLAEIKETIEYPMFVKPANAGSSMGISKAYDDNDLRLALAEAFEHDEKAVIEQAIEGREIEVSVLEKENGEIFVSLAGEIIPDRDFYDYESKYISSDSKLIIPAKLTDDEKRTLAEYAKKAFAIVDGEGLCRADFFIENKSKRVLLNEINTLPGFTSISMYPKLLEASGYSAEKLMESLIRSAFK